MYRDAIQQFSRKLRKNRTLLAENQHTRREATWSSSQRQQTAADYRTPCESIRRFYQKYHRYGENLSSDNKYRECSTSYNTQETAQQMLLHDIRGPLGRITSLLSLIHDHQDLPEELQNFIHMAMTQSQQLDELTKIHFIYHQLAQGTYLPKKESFNLPSLCHDIQWSLCEQHSNHPIEINVHGYSCTSGDIHRVYTDPVLLKLIFQNLIQNAVEASLADQSVQVDIHLPFKKGKRNFLDKIPPTCFTIHNYGVIPKEIRSRFFEKFVTYGKSTGTGLGTYITKLAVEALGGMITFTTSETCGTSLRVQLPNIAVPKHFSVQYNIF